MLDLQEEALDEVALAVECEVARDLRQGCSWWNDRFGVLLFDSVAERLCVIALVAQDVIGRETVNQSLGLRNVAGLSRREDKPQRVAQSIDDGMDFGRQPAA